MLKECSSKMKDYDVRPPTRIAIFTFLRAISKNLWYAGNVSESRVADCRSTDPWSGHRRNQFIHRRIIAMRDREKPCFWFSGIGWNPLPQRPHLVMFNGKWWEKSMPKKPRKKNRTIDGRYTGRGGLNEKTENLVLVVLITTVNLLLAFIISGLVIWSVGRSLVCTQNHALWSLWIWWRNRLHPLLYNEFHFTGLALQSHSTVDFSTLVQKGRLHRRAWSWPSLSLAGRAPFVVILPAAIMASAMFGAIWGAIPGYLQAKRGSHVVITTIMFNFIASVLMVYLLVNVLIKPGQMSPETRVR